jgi:hypothetical protein
MAAPNWAALAAAVLSRRDTPFQGVPLSRPLGPGQRDTWPKPAEICGFQVSRSDAERSPKRDTWRDKGGPRPPAAEPQTWPALARRVEAFLAAGAEVRPDGAGFILTAADGCAMHLTPTGLRSLPPALAERLASAAEGARR